MEIQKIKTCLLVWQHLPSTSARFQFVHQSEILVEDFHAQRQLKNTSQTGVQTSSIPK
jgi:hypothetical protein